MIKVKTPDGYEIEAPRVEDIKEIMKELKQTVEINIISQDESIICPNCSHTDVEWIEDEEVFVCMNEECNFEFTLSDR